MAWNSLSNSALYMGVDLRAGSLARLAFMPPVRLPNTCSMTLCMSGERGGRSTRSACCIPIEARGALLWMGGLSKLNNGGQPCVKMCGCRFATLNASSLKYSSTCRNSSEVGPRAIVPFFVCMAGRPAHQMTTEVQTASVALGMGGLRQPTYPVAQEKCTILWQSVAAI